MISITLLRAQALFRFKLLLFSQQYALELGRIGNRAFRKANATWKFASLRAFAWRKKLSAAHRRREGAPLSEDGTLTTALSQLFGAFPSLLMGKHLIWLANHC